jgi:hypothetical protein
MTFHPLELDTTTEADAKALGAWLADARSSFLPFLELARLVGFLETEIAVETDPKRLAWLQERRAEVWVQYAPRAARILAEGVDTLGGLPSR